MIKKANRKRKRKLSWRFKVIAAISVFVGIYWFIPPVWKLAETDMTVWQSSERNPEKTYPLGPSRKGWTKHESVSRHIIDAIVASEDARFYQHLGLDFEEILHSIDTNINKGRKARGASTITQQVVKMAFLTRKKSYVRKAREAVGALILEQLFEKKQIMEWYVNLAEFGPNIFGINAAAWHYFQTRPGRLTIRQSIHIALVLPNPRLWSTGLRQKELTEFGHKRYAQIAENMRLAGFITESEWIDILSTGNFGAPIKDRDKLLTQYFQEKEEKG